MAPPTRPDDDDSVSKASSNNSGNENDSFANGGGGKKGVAKRSDYPMSNIKVLCDHDVLCGRGGGTNNHSGNIRFRKLVNGHKVRYLAAPKVDKPKVAREVVKLWRALNPPGRFLARLGGGGTTTTHSVDSSAGKDGDLLWYDVGDKKAREKASQCLMQQRQQDFDQFSLNGGPTATDRHHQGQQQQQQHRLGCKTVFEGNNEDGPELEYDGGGTTTTTTTTGNNAQRSCCRPHHSSGNDEKLKVRHTTATVIMNVIEPARGTFSKTNFERAQNMLSEYTTIPKGADGRAILITERVPAFMNNVVLNNTLPSYEFMLYCILLLSRSKGDDVVLQCFFHPKQQQQQEHPACVRVFDVWLSLVLRLLNNIQELHKITTGKLCIINERDRIEALIVKHILLLIKDFWGGKQQQQHVQEVYDSFGFNVIGQVHKALGMAQHCKLHSLVDIGQSTLSFLVKKKKKNSQQKSIPPMVESPTQRQRNKHRIPKFETRSSSTSNANQGATTTSSLSTTHSELLTTQEEERNGVVDDERQQTLKDENAIVKPALTKLVPDYILQKKYHQTLRRERNKTLALLEENRMAKKEICSLKQKLQEMNTIHSSSVPSRGTASLERSNGDCSDDDDCVYVGTFVPTNRSGDSMSNGSPKLAFVKKEDLASGKRKQTSALREATRKGNATGSWGASSQSRRKIGGGGWGTSLHCDIHQTDVAGTTNSTFLHANDNDARSKRLRTTTPSSASDSKKSSVVGGGWTSDNKVSTINGWGSTPNDGKTQPRTTTLSSASDSKKLSVIGGGWTGNDKVSLNKGWESTTNDGKTQPRTTTLSLASDSKKLSAVGGGWTSDNKASTNKGWGSTANDGKTHPRTTALSSASDSKKLSAVGGGWTSDNKGSTINGWGSTTNDGKTPRRTTILSLASDSKKLSAVGGGWTGNDKVSTINSWGSTANDGKTQLRTTTLSSASDSKKLSAVGGGWTSDNKVSTINGWESTANNSKTQDGQTSISSQKLSVAGGGWTNSNDVSSNNGWGSTTNNSSKTRSGTWGTGSNADKQNLQISISNQKPSAGKGWTSNNKVSSTGRSTNNSNKTQKLGPCGMRSTVESQEEQTSICYQKLSVDGGGWTSNNEISSNNGWGRSTNNSNIAQSGISKTTGSNVNTQEEQTSIRGQKLSVGGRGWTSSNEVLSNNGWGCTNNSNNTQKEGICGTGLNVETQEEQTSIRGQKASNEVSSNNGRASTNNSNKTQESGICWKKKDPI